MEDYLILLLRCFANIERCTFNVKIEEESVWGYCERQNEIKYPEEKALTTEGKIQMLRDEFDSCHAVQTLPKNVCLRKLTIPESRIGIWSNTEIPRGVRFGPYEGSIDFDEKEQNCYWWKVMKIGFVNCFVNAEDESESNWLRYVNFASHPKQQNLTAVKCDNEHIYFETIKTVLPDTELLVWYGDGYAAEFGIGENDECEDCEFEIMNRIQKNDMETNESSTRIETPELNLQVCSKEKEYIENSPEIKNQFEVYENQKYFACTVCKKCFPISYGYKQHMNTHEEKLYRCNVCKKCFPTSYGYRQHMNTHKEKKYRCSVCKKCFPTSYGYKKHMNTHKEKPYRCNVCFKTFKQYSHAKEHMYIHTGEKPHMCHLCGKRFTTNGNVKRHMSVHMKEKLFVCNLCGRRFRTNSKQHKNILAKEKPYMCHLCEKRFSRIGIIKKRYV